MAFDAPVFEMQMLDCLSQQSLDFPSARWVDGISTASYRQARFLVFESHCLAFHVQNFIKSSHLILYNQRAFPEQLTFFGITLVCKT